MREHACRGRGAAIATEPGAGDVAAGHGRDRAGGHVHTPHAPAVLVGDEQVSFPVDRKALGAVQARAHRGAAVAAGEPAPAARDRGDDARFGVDAPHARAVLDVLGDIEVARRVERDRGRVAQAGRGGRNPVRARPPAAVAREAAHQLRAGIDPPHAVPILVGDEEITGAIDRDAGHRVGAEAGVEGQATFAAEEERSVPADRRQEPRQAVDARDPVR